MAGRVPGLADDSGHHLCALRNVSGAGLLFIRGARIFGSRLPHACRVVLPAGLRGLSEDLISDRFRCDQRAGDDVPPDVCLFLPGRVYLVRCPYAAAPAAS